MCYNNENKMRFSDAIESCAAYHCDQRKHCMHFAAYIERKNAGIDTQKDSASISCSHCDKFLPISLPEEVNGCECSATNNENIEFLHQSEQGKDE